MFSEFLNYIVIPTLVSAGTVCVYYIWNPDGTEKLISDIAWYGVNMYSKVSIIIENISIQDDNMSEEEEEEDMEESLSYFNSKNHITVSIGTDYKELPEDWYKNTNVDLLMLEIENSNKEQYKIFHSYETLIKSSEEWETLDKLFVQVELEQNNKVIDLHKHLDNFYVVGNEILSKPFLQWYLKTWYNTTLQDEYTLKIFDKDVNLFSIGPGTHIHINEDGYSIVDEKSENDTEYEGAVNE